MTPTFASAATPLPTLQSIVPATPHPPTPPTHPQISLYADLDYATHHLRVRQTITYPNRTGVQLNHIALDVLAAHSSSVFTLVNAHIQNDPDATFSLDDTVLRVNWSQPLESNATISMTLEYTLDLPAIPADADGTSGTLGWSARQVNLGDWFPSLSAYRDGWLAERNPPYPLGETTAPEAVDLSLDLGITNAPTGLQILASAPAQYIDGRYQFRLEGARSFALSLGTQFEIAEISTPSGILVRSAYFPEHAIAGRAALQIAADAVEIYAAHYGPYHHQQLAVVEADFFDGMEYSGFYFLGNDYYAKYDGTPRNYLTAIAAHEVAHQWWYDQVGNDQAREPWLDESLCIYSELVYYEAIHPELVDWWWDFRVARFNPTGWVNSAVYDHTSFRSYVNAVYLRGALFLEELRKLMGDEVFFTFLQNYAAQGAYRQVTSADFFRVLGNHTSANLDSLTAKYFTLPVK